MSVFRETFSFAAKGFCDIHNITDKVANILAKSKISEGLCNVFVSGSTIALTTVEYEPGLIKDIKEFFEQILPQTKYYHHNETWHDGNGFSHMRASLLGPDCTVPVHKGGLLLGTWQQIIAIDFDNKPRTRQITVTIVGDENASNANE